MTYALLPTPGHDSEWLLEASFAGHGCVWQWGKCGLFMAVFNGAGEWMDMYIYIYR